MVRRKNSRINTKIEQITQALTFSLGTPMSILVHTILFAGSFAFLFFGVEFSTILLVVTTIVSLEAIYLSLFIQMTVNQHTKSLQNVEENIDDIQEDIEDVGEDIDKIQEDDEAEEEEDVKDSKTFAAIENQLVKLGTDMTMLTQEIQTLKHKQNSSTNL